MPSPMTVSRVAPRSIVALAPISTSSWMMTRLFCGTLPIPSKSPRCAEPSWPIHEPGWSTTRSPISALITVALAPIAQWRPMQTSGPITAPAAIDSAGTELGTGADHRERIDGHACLDPGRGMYPGTFGAAADTEQRGWPQRIGKQRARYSDEGTIRFLVEKERESAAALIPQAAAQSSRRRRAFAPNPGET